MTISEFLWGGYNSFDSKIDAGLLSKLVNDFGIPSETVEIIGAKKTEYNMFSETHILYRFPKTSEGLGGCLKHLGTLINRIPLEEGMDLGIQELDSSRPDGYYILFYLLEGMRE